MADFASEFLREYLNALLKVISINDVICYANRYSVAEISDSYLSTVEGIIASSFRSEITDCFISRMN